MSTDDLGSGKVGMPGGRIVPIVGYVEKCLDELDPSVDWT